jgi:hypothetical protein
VNPTSAAIIGLIPMPNYGAANAQSRNFFIALPRHNRDDRGDVRIDHTISSSNSLYGRFSMANSPNVSVGSFGAGNWIGGGSTSLDNSRQMALSDVHVFSPTTVNEFRFGYVRSNSSSVGTAPQGVAFAQQNKMALFFLLDLSLNHYAANRGAHRSAASAEALRRRLKPFQWVQPKITQGYTRKSVRIAPLALRNPERLQHPIRIHVHQHPTRLAEAVAGFSLGFSIPGEAVDARLAREVSTPGISDD